MALKRAAKRKQIVERIVREDPSLASVAPLFIYPGDRLEVLASILNDVPPDSPNRFLADLIGMLVTSPPARQDWAKQEDLAPIIGATPCTPATGSPLYELNKFLETSPCILRVEGRERANGNIEFFATHIPFSIGLLVGDERLTVGRETDNILWLLWEVFYRGIDLTRLKKCTVCHRWFVDHSKNKSKTRCSPACTSRYWNWTARKDANHNLPGTKRKTGTQKRTYKSTKRRNA